MHDSHENTQLMDSTEDISKKIESVESSKYKKDEVNTIYMSKLAKEELGIDKWIALGLYVLVAFCTGLIHGGFSEWQPIILKTGAFEELCTDGLTSDVKIASDYVVKMCDSRSAAINNLSTMALFVQLLSSPVNGYILDRFGPRICFLYGHIIITIAFVLLSILGRYSFIWYVFFFLLGLSTDAACVSLLKISKYFPDKESLVFGILGSARSTSFAIPLILRMIFFSGLNMKPGDFYILTLGFLGTCVLYSVLIGIFFFPKQTSKTVINSENALDNFSENGTPQKKSLNEVESGLQNTNDKMKESVTLREQIKLIWTHPQRTEYLIIVFICAMSALRMDYYMKSNMTFFIYKNHNITTLYSISTILSFIPAPLFGYLTDKIGIFSVLFINNMCLLLSYIFILFTPLFCRILSIIFFFIYLSFCLSSYYCYINRRYPSEHFGKLIGTMFVISAIILTSNFGLTYLTDVVFSDWGEEKYVPVTSGLCAVGGIVIIAIFILWKFIVKESAPMKNDSSKK